MDSVFTDHYFMDLALKQAQLAFDEDEVPVGAIVVYKNQIIGKGYNQTERLKDCTAHAEMLAITSASNYIQSKYLEDCTLYVTLEPCLMCIGAIQAARLSRMVYAASEPKTGFTVVVPQFTPAKIEIVSGIENERASHIMNHFFVSKR